jgi:hypothetical protein
MQCKPVATRILASVHLHPRVLPVNSSEVSLPLLLSTVIGHQLNNKFNKAGIMEEDEGF